jgi:hypothetical protein
MYRRMRILMRPRYHQLCRSIWVLKASATASTRKERLVRSHSLDFHKLLAPHIYDRPPGYYGILTRTIRIGAIVRNTSRVAGLVHPHDVWNALEERQRRKLVLGPMPAPRLKSLNSMFVLMVSSWVLTAVMLACTLRLRKW